MKASDLCGFGFLPEVLPPIFTSRKFGEYVEGQPANYVGLGKTNFRLDPYNASKRGHARRLFSVPNPVCQFNSALFIEKNWTEIESLLDRSKISQSKPKSSAPRRAVAITSHKNVDRLRQETTFRYRFVVKTDIARFYPSIYTHAVPWAFHGMKASKQDTSSFSSINFANRLDYYLRNAQSAQTIGIPVGPDVSRIVAEVLSSAIDAECPSINKKGRAVRHVDDIWIGAETEAKAQSLLSEYREALRRFELDLSEPKTRICRSSQLFDDSWPAEISRRIGGLRNTFLGEASDTDEVVDLITFTLKTAHASEDDGVIKYLIRKIDTRRAWGAFQRWALFEKFLMVSALNFPHSIDYVARIIAWKRRIGHSVDIKSWVKICNDVVSENAKLRHDSEVCWATWLIRELGGKLNKGAFDEIARFSSSTGCLAGTLLHVEGKTSAGTTLDTIKERFAQESTVGRNWLFAHEALVRGWLTAADFDQTEDHDFLQEMRAKNIRFVDEFARPGVFTANEQDDDGADMPDIGIEEHLGGYDDDLDDEIPDDFDDEPL